MVISCLIASFIVTIVIIVMRGGDRNILGRFRKYRST
jgi:hypothetical protein